MSRFGGPALRIASKTTFEALEVHSGEESDGSSDFEKDVTAERFVQDTYVFIPRLNYCDSLPTEPAKLTKSAIKKANRIARLERKQAQKEKARKERLAGDSALSGPSTNSEGLDVISPVPAESVELEPRGDVTPAVLESISDEEPVPRPTILASQEPPPEPLVKSTNGFHPVPNTNVDIDEKEQVADISVPEPHNGVLANGTFENATTTTTPVTEDPETVKKRQNVLTRTLWTFIMIGGFISMSSIYFKCFGG
jgi:phosphatidate cytidylyltransferase